MIRRLLMKRLQEVNLSPEEGLALLQRLENDTCSAEDRHLLVKVMRATQASQKLLEESTPPPSTRPQRKAKDKRQLAQASRRRNRR